MKKILTTVTALLLVVTMAFMAACTPKDVDAAKEKMEDAGYIVIGYQTDEDVEGLIGGIVATKTTETITALLFDSKESASDFADTHDHDSDGKWVYYGTEGAIEDFTK